jgi:hypothetical protein
LRIDGLDQRIDWRTVVGRPLCVKESNHAVRIENGIPAKLSDVPLAWAPAPSVSEQAGVKPKGARIQ